MTKLSTFRALLIVSATLAIGACGKKSEKSEPAAETTAAKATETPAAAKPADKPADPAPAAEPPAAPAADPAADPAAAAAPVKVDVKALFAEFSPEAKGDPMALLDKYRGGATFTAKVKRVQPAGDSIVMILDVDGKNTIQPSFTDEKAMLANPPKVGDALTLTCKIGGEVDTLMQVLDCVVAK